MAVEGDGVQLPVDDALVPDARLEVGLGDAELGEPVGVPRIEQAAGREAGHAGRVHDGDVGARPPTDAMASFV
ncbi:hypothetical protein MAFF212519_21320 [Clavibacter michiganensis]